MNRFDLDDLGEKLPENKAVGSISNSPTKKGQSKATTPNSIPATSDLGDGMEGVLDEYGELIIPTEEGTTPLQTNDKATDRKRWSLIGLGTAGIFFLVGLVLWIIGLQNIQIAPDTKAASLATATASAKTTNEGSNITVNPPADLQRLDGLYAKAVSDRASQKITNSLVAFEELDKLQNQLKLEKYPDVPKALFDIYMDLGAVAWQSSQPDDFDKGFAYYKEAEKILPRIAAKDQDKKKAETLKLQLTNGNYYFIGVTAYNQTLWASAVSSFEQLYKSNPKLRPDVIQLYYDSLYNRAEELKATELDQAYQYVWAANNLPEITDKRRSAALLTLLESKYRDQGKPTPTPKV